MKIWVDADACPKVIRETLIRAAERTGVECTFVANHLIPLPKRDNIRALQVSSGFDIADNEIVRRTEAGDLVITADIPLADEVISKGGLALNPRGELYTRDHQSAPEYSRFYGYHARQRHSNRWPCRAFADRTARVCQSSGQNFG